MLLAANILMQCTTVELTNEELSPPLCATDDLLISGKGGGHVKLFGNALETLGKQNCASDATACSLVS